MRKYFTLKCFFYKSNQNVSWYLYDLKNIKLRLSFISKCAENSGLKYDLLEYDDEEDEIN